MALGLGRMLCIVRLHGPVRADQCKLVKYDGTLPVEMVGERATTQVKVNGVDTRFGLDTGAEFNIMSRANANALGLKPYPDPVPSFSFGIRGVGGKVSVELVSIKDLGILGMDFHQHPI